MMLKPAIKPASGRGERYEVADDFVAKLPTTRAYLRVRAGFKTDGASIPALLWPLIGNPYDPHTIGPAIIHDALYSAETFPRDRADRIFLALLRQNSREASRKAATFYRAVRWFGWLVWRRHTDVSRIRAREFVKLEEI
jgi:hypothetical protein